MAKEIITSKPDLPSEFKTYPGTTHGEMAHPYNYLLQSQIADLYFGLVLFEGFAARPNMAIPEIREAFNGAIDQVVNWFTLHLLNT